MVAKQTVKQTAQHFFSLDMQDIEREDNSDAPKTAPKTVAFVNCPSLFAQSRLKFVVCL